MPSAKTFMLKAPLTAHLAAAPARKALVQPLFIAAVAKPVVAGKAKAVRVNPLPTPAAVAPNVKVSPAVKIQTVRLVNPRLADLIAKVRLPPAGVKRSEVKVPISPTDQVTDQVLFEDGTDATKKFFLPRYRLVVHNQQFQLSLAADGDQWALTAHFEKVPAPEIEQASRGAQEIDHSISVILTHQLTVGGSNVGQKEMVFQEVTAEGHGVKAVLRLATLPERDRLYQALTDPALGARLVVRRAVQVGVPSGTPPPPSSRFVMAAPMFMAGTTAARPAVSRHAPVARSGAAQPPHPVAAPPQQPQQPAPGGGLFRQVTRTLDDVIEPKPFVFPPALNGYIFGTIAPAPGQGLQLVRRQVGSNVYYQDPAEEYLFYYLPDVFKIARVPQSPHVPFMMVQFTAPDDDPSPESIEATLNYAAVPFIDPDRLEADGATLKERYLSGSLPAGLDGPVFEPLLVDSDGLHLQLSLPRAEGSAGPYQERKGAEVDLRTGVHDILTLPIKDFQAVFDALFSPVSLLFDGRIAVDVGDGPDAPSETVPLIARMNNLAGDVFDYEESPDASSGGVRATLKNAIESPVMIKRLSAELEFGDDRVEGRIEDLILDSPRQLQPGEDVQLVVAPAKPTSGGQPPHALFDLDGVDVLPDKEAIWNAILDPYTSQYLRIIHVQTFKEMFDPPADKPDEQILEIDVELKRGSEQAVTVSLKPEALETDVKLPVPIGDFVLKREDQGEYSYRVTAIRRQQAKEGDWKTASRDTLWVLSSEVS